MTTTTIKPVKRVIKNPIETYSDKPSPAQSDSISEFERKLAALQEQNKSSETAKPQPRNEINLFSRERYFEDKKKYEVIESISQQIKKEITVIKARTAEFNTEIDQIDIQLLQSLPEKPGEYHVRYMEYLLYFLRGLRERVSEAKTWLTAMMTKRKKRGSLFLTMSKKKGTQYSLSQEMSASRSVA
jgi:hypothetical protein